MNKTVLDFVQDLNVAVVASVNDELGWVMTEFENGLSGDISIDDLASEQQHQKVAGARKICFYFARLHPAASLSSNAIGRLYNRDHSTVLHQLRRLHQLFKRPRYPHLRAAKNASDLLRAKHGAFPALDDRAAPRPPRFRKSRPTKIWAAQDDAIILLAIERGKPARWVSEQMDVSVNAVLKRATRIGVSFSRLGKRNRDQVNTVYQATQLVKELR